MQALINKWGNSAAVRIPASILADTGLSVHSTITIEVREGKIIIAPAASAQPRVDLPFSEEELLQGMTAYTAHADELADMTDIETGEE